MKNSKNKLSEDELNFLGKHELCRLATASKKGIPHVTPVVYAMDGEKLVVAIDYGTKKLKLLRENDAVSLVVDDYDPNRAVVISGTCQIFERGDEYRRLLKVLFDRFDFYRNNPWKEGESPIIKIAPETAVSWGVGRRTG